MQLSQLLLVPCVIPVVPVGPISHFFCRTVAVVPGTETHVASTPLHVFLLCSLQSSLNYANTNIKWDSWNLK